MLRHKTPGAWRGSVDRQPGEGLSTGEAGVAPLGDPGLGIHHQ